VNAMIISPSDCGVLEILDEDYMPCTTKEQRTSADNKGQQLFTGADAAVDIGEHVASWANSKTQSPP